MRKIQILIFLVFISSLFNSVTFGEKNIKYVYTLSYTFENRGSTSFELTQEDVSIPLFMNTSWQVVKLETVDRDYSIRVIDEDDNIGAVVDINRILLPSQKESFTAVYAISSTNKNTHSFNLDEAQGKEMISEYLVNKYTIPTDTFPADDPELKEIALEIVGEGDSVLESVSALVEYIIRNTTYHSFEVPQYPKDTLNDKLGDCDDLSILLITLCRSLDIPSYLQVGIYLNPEIDVKDVGYNGHIISLSDGVGWHGWAMIFIPPWGWVPVDLTLTDSNSGLELIRNAPEYHNNIITVLNVSNQSYIGDVIATRDRIINSQLYVSISDIAYIVYSSDNPIENYLLIGLGVSLIISIGLMFRYSNQQ